MIRFAACHEIYFFKEMAKDVAEGATDRKYVGHGLCYLKEAMSGSREACTDAYAVRALGMTLEYGYDLLYNIVEYAAQAPDTVSSKGDTVLDDMENPEKDAASCLAQMHESEEAPFLRAEICIWTDNIMDNCKKFVSTNDDDAELANMFEELKFWKQV